MTMTMPMLMPRSSPLRCSPSRHVQSCLHAHRPSQLSPVLASHQMGSATRPLTIITDVPPTPDPDPALRSVLGTGYLPCL
eukprot:gene6648-biopygen5514